MQESVATVLGRRLGAIVVVVVFRARPSERFSMTVITRRRRPVHTSLVSGAVFIWCGAVGGRRVASALVRHERFGVGRPVGAGKRPETKARLLELSVGCAMGVPMGRRYLVDEGGDVEGGGYALLGAGVAGGLELVRLGAREGRGGLLEWFRRSVVVGG